MIELIPGVIRNILIKIEENGFEAYLVGGFVRDYLLHRDTNDFDIATNAKPKDITYIFGPSKKECEYGSFHMKLDSYNIDITTYRRERNVKSRTQFQMEYTTNMIFDAERRDFTINAIYMNKNGEILDPLESIKDIQSKKVKMIGNPRVRLQEDPLRILRAVRFASTYSLKIDKNLIKAIKKEKQNLTLLSKERIKQELDLILLAGGFRLLKDLDLLDVLGIKNKKIVYVKDLAGLWAQIETSVEYPKEKNLKKREKNIALALKYGKMDMMSLYQNGFYDSRIIGTILHFPVKKLETMMCSLPITSRKDIIMSSKEISQMTNKKGSELGILLKELEKKIVLGKVKNTKESIENYLKSR